ncbi:sigma factor sigB regulation protein rsbU [Bdellovibrio bacteriovorus]|uniref:Sigma factor sigB regulation protein rsbU n=1 Tax=Bdellovibrio bacteriovorus TaxID=959 RepID=A0A150WHM4_BDEBC|nr:SpoIIE family protein phosphatase [Bdellovibrio bacteriovorus]KYG63120.1 sigma factor sigB regulation protein rsbU [Bdellovibrio bacteriovorus]
MKKRGISIRYKILALLTLLPLITLSIYLVLALRIFEDDKIAYVFDSSSNMSGTMAAQIKTQLNAVLGTTRPIFQDYLTTQKFSGVSDSIFMNEPDLEALVVFTPDAQGVYQKNALLEKVPGKTAGIITSLRNNLPTYFTEVDRLRRVVKVPYNDDRVFIFEKVSDEATKRTTVFMVIARMSEAAEMFRTSMSQKMYLVSEEGLILFGPEGTVGSRLQQIVNPAFLRNGAQQVAQGAEAARSTSGVDLLVSYSRAGFGDLSVVTTVEKEKALGAVQVLIRKSLIFFGILISVTVILSLFASSGITQALTSLFDATKKVSEGDFNIRVDVKSNDEVGSLADNFNIMAAEVSRLLEQTAEKARMESELQTAKTVQETLFPETRAKIGPLAIAGYYEPASECGGDWWHYCKVENKIFLWIGDATGHGAPAALITSAAKSASTIIEKLNISPSKALELLNTSIYDVSKGRIMMTFFLASFDLDTGELVYCNASHEAPFLIKKTDNLKKKDLIPLNEVNNPRLGQARDSVYKQTSVQLEEGDAVFFYTDGIPDIQNQNQEAWGEREFLKALVATHKGFQTPGEVVDQFVTTFQGHRQGAPLVDDVTFFVVKRESQI